MKLLIIFLLLLSSLFAESVSSRYNVNVSLFGSVGYIDVILEEKKDTYKMTMIANTTGTAATLTANRLETYTSEGKIIDGVYRPNSFIKIKKTNHKKRVQTYHFNHSKKEITLIEEKEKLVNESNFDPISFKIVSKDVLKKSKNKSKLDIYHENDVLSAFMNTKKSFNKKSNYKLEAVGAHNDKKDVSLHLLNDKQKSKILSNFSQNIGNVCNLNVTPHDKDDTIVDILIGFDNDGHMKEAVLGDIFWIGKITAQRAYCNVEAN